jgi:hypothetical protein
MMIPMTRLIPSSSSTSILVVHRLQSVPLVFVLKTAGLSRGNTVDGKRWWRSGRMQILN